MTKIGDTVSYGNGQGVGIVTYIRGVSTSVKIEAGKVTENNYLPTHYKVNGKFWNAEGVSNA